MPKKERRCEHPYMEWDMEKGYPVEKPCPHPYFGPGAHPETGEEIDCCIFHSSMEVKKDHLGLFWFKFWRLFARSKKRVEAAETAEEKKNVRLECCGFAFPDTGGRFRNREFPFSVILRRARFSGDAYFSHAQFSGVADFSDATFSRNALFGSATFSGDADFSAADQYFPGATFSGNAYFEDVMFLGDARFCGVAFEENVSFHHAYINKSVYFGGAGFSKDADFRAVIALADVTVLFEYAYFYRPEKVFIGGKGRFGSDLSRWSFRGTNIEKVRFVEPCWPDEKGRKGRKRTLDEERAKKGEISWAEAGEVYRKLRKNFEDNLAYEAAGDFHVGQMECRLKDPERKPWDRALTFAYKLVSGYGESVGRPLWWLLGFFAVFTSLFLVWTGFPAADGSAVDWAWGFKGLSSGEWWSQLWDGISFTLRSSVSFAVPGYAENVDAKVGATLPALMFAWKVVAVTIATFFILALRRRFRR